MHQVFLSLYIFTKISFYIYFYIDFSWSWSSPLWTHWMFFFFFFYHPVYIYYILSSRSCTSQTRSCPSRHTAIMAIRRNRCTSSGTVRKSSSRVKTSRSQAQGRTLRLFGTDLMRHAIIRRRSPRVIYCLILYRLTPLVFWSIVSDSNPIFSANCIIHPLSIHSSILCQLIDRTI